jgi:protein ImuB
MQRRYVSIWFRYLKTDWYTRHHQDIKDKAFVMYLPQHGRMVITAINAIAEMQGIFQGSVLADAKAILPNLSAQEDQPVVFEKLLLKFGEWFIRYSPVVAIDAPDGIIIDATGCTHLWGNEENYINDITNRLGHLGYTVQTAIAGTIGTAWAVCRYGQTSIVANGEEKNALSKLPAAALRLQDETLESLQKLGLRYISDFISMPVAALRRRFGNDFINRLHQALGMEMEWIDPVEIIPPFYERLYCLEPIVTRTGIEIALQKLLETLCGQLSKEQKGIRLACLKIFRVDGVTQKIEIGTHQPSNDKQHLYKLFEGKLQIIAPALGIELFVLEVLQSEEHRPVQEKMWLSKGDVSDTQLAMLIDRISNKIGEGKIHRYLPDEHYWPERSIKKAGSLNEKSPIPWPIYQPRPLRILLEPEAISVTAPVPDYPPMFFRHKGKMHKIKKADGPERIEQEWWLQEGLHRDYYYVEDEEGCRYWIFRSGHYEADRPVGWYLHGYCV